jgi:hypothetical protein
MLLKTALQAHYRRPLDLAVGSGCPGCFGVKAMMTKYEDKKQRATRRADTGRSIARLVARGLVECCARGKWRLTKRGATLARALYPEIVPLSKRGVASTIALREAVHAVAPRRRCKRVSAKKAGQPAKEPEVEIPFDF